jgi:Protein of unknown function (DUF3153)
MGRTAQSQSLFSRSPLPSRGRRLSAIALDLIRDLLRLRLLWLILIAFFLLSGCVRSDIGIRFKDANHGKIIQHIHLAESKTGLENTITSVWLDSVVQQAEKLGGSVRRSANQDATLTLPFFNAKDLEAKFNQLLQTEWQSSTAQSSTAQKVPAIVSRLKLRSGNWILWQRIVLDYALNLRSLSPLVQENLSLDPSKLLQLEFSLNTPGNAKSLNAENPPVLRPEGKKLTWKLHPGEQNHLQAVFWVPSPLGIGAVLIGLFVIVGAIVRTHPLPAEKSLTDEAIATE